MAAMTRATTEPARLPESQRLRERGAATWAAAIGHPMVAAIGAGTLPHETFRFYFEQNVQYLHSYVQAIALTIAAAPDRTSQATLARFLAQITDVEIPANIGFLLRLGGSPGALPAPRPTTRGYAEHLLRAARSGNVAVSLAALLPCQWSYGEIGRRLAAGGGPADPVYADWIAMFSGDGYDEMVHASTSLLDACADVADAAATQAAFDEATAYELAFWEMAYTRGASDGDTGRHRF
jgi:thiaminase (transcriptional activator TenA)